MSFDEILRRRLRPLQDLVGPTPQPAAPAHDPATLWYRRALGVEARAHPERSRREIELHGPRGDWIPYDLQPATQLAGLTRWTHARDTGLTPAQLWRAVEQDLLYFATYDPGVPLAGTGGALPADRPIARRASVWPTLALEDAIKIAPFPFMPRRGDLASAEVVGARFSSRERGQEVFGATITGTSRTGAILRDLLPLLNGRRTAEEIAGAFDPKRREAAAELLRLLDRLTVLEPAPPEGPVQARLQSPPAAQVTWLGHAAVLYQTGRTNILADPIFFAPSDPPERWLSAERFDPRALPRIDAVLITHGDNDHLNPTALAFLPRATPVIIPPVGEHPPPYQVDLRGVLRVLGFERVTELEPWATLDVGDATITACPFAGEDWGLDLARVTYHVESRDLTVFLAADASAMDDTYRAIASWPRRVDLAFMGVSGCAESFAVPSEYGYGNFYEPWIPAVRRNEWIQHCSGPREALHSLQVFTPRYAFGYAAGGASFIQTAFSDTGDHAALAELIRGAGLATRPVALPLGVPVTLDELATSS